MKRFFFLLVFTTVSLFSTLKAQYNFVQPPNPATYDLLYVFDTNYITMCFATDNKMQTEFDYDSPWGVMHFAPPYIVLFN